jgi:hypothetical protein
MAYHRRSLLALQAWLFYGLQRGKPWRSAADIIAQDLESPGTKTYSSGDDSDLGLRAYLRGGGSQGIGGLQEMPSLDASAALLAAADMDVELPMNGLAGDFDLELCLHVGFLERAAALGASLRQRGFQRFVDLLGRGRLAMSFLAVACAGLTAGLLGVGLRRSLGEGSRLALAGTLGFFQLLRPGRHARFEFRDALPELGTLGTNRWGHTSRLAKSCQSSCASFGHRARLNGSRR